MMDEVAEESTPVTEDEAAQPKRRMMEGVSGGDVGLLLLRVLIGMIFLGHGLQKLGWFKGGGYPTTIAEQKQFLQLLGYTSSGLLAWALTIAEVGAGVSLILGFLTPLGAAAVMGIMLQFVAGGQWDAGLFGNATASGYEFALAFLAAGLALAFVGPGNMSVDHALGWRLEGWRWGLASVVLGLGVGAIVLTVFGVGFGGTPTISGD